MEYLVTMTTQVPAGTSEAEVDDVKAREAAHSRELATDGRLLRLWRPPLHAGWSGAHSVLFDAPDRAALEARFSSPCRSECGAPMTSWRSERIRTTQAHNQPGSRAHRHEAASEFFTTFTMTVSTRPPRSQRIDDAKAEGGDFTRENWLRQGLLLRLVAPCPVQGRALGLWKAFGLRAVMESVIASLPLQALVRASRPLPLSVPPERPCVDAGLRLKGTWTHNNARSPSSRGDPRASEPASSRAIDSTRLGRLWPWRRDIPAPAPIRPS